MLPPPSAPPAPKIVMDVKGTFPSLRMDDELLKRIGKIGEGAVLENIIRQKQADGSRLQRNKKSTIDLKIRKGNLWRGRAMSLIDEKKRFVKGGGRSFRSRKADGNSVIIAPSPFGSGNPSIKQLATWLQQPHEERNSYTGWFGLNKKAVGAIRSELRRWIREEFKKASKRLKGYRPEFTKR